VTVGTWQPGQGAIEWFGCASMRGGARERHQRIAGMTEGTGVAVGNVEFLFDSHGAVVAFRYGQDVFDLDLCWLGWAPWNDGDVFDPAGHYLGTITPAGQLYEIEVRRGLTSPPPRTPTLGCHPDPPRAGVPMRLPAGMRDIRPRRLVRPHQLADPVAVDGDADPLSDPVRVRLSTGSSGPAPGPASEISGSSSGLGVSIDHEGDGANSLSPLEPQTHQGQAPHGRGRRRVGRPG